VVILYKTKGYKIMAKILKRIPKRKHGKYADIGYAAEDVLLNVQDVYELIEEVQQNKELNDDEKKHTISYLNGEALLSCISVSYYKGNGLNTFQNAEKTGLTEKMTDEQKDILRKLSKNVSLARILYTTGKYSVYALVGTMMFNLYANSHLQIFKNIIQPKQTYVFICVALFCMCCILVQERLTNICDYELKQLVGLNER
jgi:hypothetical protein